MKCGRIDGTTDTQGANMYLADLPYSTRAAALALLLISATLQAQSIFPIEVSSELNELDLAVASSSLGNQVVVSVKNKEGFAVHCRAVFHNGPQTTLQRRVKVAAGKTASMSAPLKRAVTVVNVELNCDRDADEAPP
jgi:hypothetical protein